MLNRLLSRRSPLRILTLISLKPHHSLNPNPNSFPLLKNPNPSFSLLRHFSTNHRNNNNHDRGATSSSDTWRLSPDPDHSTDSIDSIFGKDDEGENIDVTGREEREAGGGWDSEKKKEYGVFDSIGVGGRQEREAGGVWGSAAGRREKNAYDVFEGIDVGGREEREAGGGWGSATGRREKKDYDVFEGIEVGRGEEREGVGEREWRLGGEKGEDDVFGDLEEGEERVEVREDGGREEREAIARKVEEEKKLEEEARVLSNVLKGPNRAFGDLISASGITEEMLDSLLALKDLGGVQGLPPLSEIEDMRYEKNTRKSSRAEIERQKQEEVAKARVRQVDDKGRAYGTGRRKCSIARVWIQPGEGKFMVNEKEFDVYFPMLDHRAALLRPFSETKTLGLWDVTCTVKGGGTSGQVGAVQLGVSRALQNWEPNLRPPLRAVGFLTRDSRVVERKKPGLAKARKSFQWVKR